MNTQSLLSALFAATVLCSLVTADVPQAIDFVTLKPTNTGVPGEEVRFTRFAPDGRLWVAARWPFFQEGGIGIVDLATTGPTETGYDTGIWTTYADWDQPSPIPGPFVNDLAFESDGVAWIATGSGLVGFDETAGEWEMWDTSNAPLIFDTIPTLEIAGDGHIWMTNDVPSSSNGALFEFDPVNETWTSYEVGDELPWELPWKALSGVEVDSRGHIWVANEVLNGVAEFDGESWTLHGDNVNRFGPIMEDLEGNIWLIAGIGGGNAFYKFDGENFTSFSPSNTPFVNTTITTMATDQDGTVYIGNWVGQVIATGDGGETWSTFTVQNSMIFGINPDPNSDDVYVNTPGAVRHLDGNGVWQKALNTYNTGMPDNFLNQIHSDSQGNLWFSSSEAGASRWDGQRWRNWGAHNALAEPWPFEGSEPAHAIYEDSEGNVWVGGNGVMKLNSEGVVVGFWDWQNSNLGVDSFESIAEDSNGDIWIGSDITGVYRLVNDDWDQHLFGQPFTTANYVRDMATDTAGNLWVATQTSLHFYNGTQWFAVGPFNGSPVELPRQIAAHPDGSVWIGASNGLIKYENGEWTIYDQSNSPMPTDSVKGLDIRDDGLIGFTVTDFGAATPFPNGVVLFDGEDSWEVYTYETDPLPHYQLEDAHFDAEGNLWVVPQSEGATKLVLSGGDDPIPGDLNNDGVVDGSDLGLLLGAFGSSEKAADLNDDSTVDGADLGLLLGNWS